MNGPIPKEIGKLNYIRYLALDQNALTGDLPSFDTMFQLDTVILKKNKFSGKADPDSFPRTLELCNLADSGICRVLTSLDSFPEACRSSTPGMFNFVLTVHSMPWNERS